MKNKLIIIWLTILTGITGVNFLSDTHLPIVNERNAFLGMWLNEEELELYIFTEQLAIRSGAGVINNINTYSVNNGELSIQSFLGVGGSSYSLILKDYRFISKDILELTAYDNKTESLCTEVFRRIKPDELTNYIPNTQITWDYRRNDEVYSQNIDYYGNDNVVQEEEYEEQPLPLVDPDQLNLTHEEAAEFLIRSLEKNGVQFESYEYSYGNSVPGEEWVHFFLVKLSNIEEPVSFGVCDSDGRVIDTRYAG